MAICDICGKDAGYLHSICEACRISIPAVPPTPPSTKRASNPLRLDPSDRAPKTNIWPWVIGAILGVPVIIFLALFAYGLSIPEYQSQARKIREVCLEYLATPDQKHVCEESYEEAMRQGRLEAGND